MPEKPVKQDKRNEESPRNYTKEEIEAKMRERGLKPIKK